MPDESPQSRSTDTEHSHTRVTNDWLKRLGRGDDSAREALIEHSCDRLRRLTRSMMHEYARVGRWEETNDVLQNSLLRLHRALQHVQPRTKRDFINFAAVQIRRELNDLARKYFGQQGMGRRYHSDQNSSGIGSPVVTHDTFNPANLAEWTEFHSQIAQLPDELREVFDLHWYQGLTQTEIAEHLQISRRTVIRRWRNACVVLRQLVMGTETDVSHHADTDEEPDA